MKGAIRLFLALSFLFSIVGVVILTLYYLKRFDLSEALQLGIVDGVLTALLVSFLVTSGVFLYTFFSQPLSKKADRTHALSTNLTDLNPFSTQTQRLYLLEAPLLFELLIDIVATHEPEAIEAIEKEKRMLVLSFRGKKITLEVTQASKHSALLSNSGIIPPPLNHLLYRHILDFENETLG